MKKKFIIFGSIAAVIVVAGIILTVALLKPNDTPPVVEDPTVELSVPRGVTLNGTVLSWDSVENATEYVVYVNDKEYTTTECSFDLSGKANERDVLKVVAKAQGYINSKFSIEKVYITVVDHKEVTSMATNLSNYISEIGYDDKTMEQIAPAIENVCVVLFKEGLVATDIENIVTTLDSVVESFENLNVTNSSDLLEAVTNELNKLVDLNVSSYALTVALKEVVSFIVDTTLEDVNVSKQDMCLVVGMKPSNGMTEDEAIELLVDLKEYLDNIKNRDLEKIAIVFDTVKNMYVALNKEIPSIVAELKELESTTKADASYEAVYSVVENLVKVKDSVVSAVLSQMPTMEEFTEVLSLFESLYDNLAPDYILENNPYDIYISLCQEAYSAAHKLLSFYKELDAELLMELKPYVDNIYTLLETEYNEFNKYLLNQSFSSIAMPASFVLVEYALKQTGLTESEIDEVIFGVIKLVEDVTEKPEEFVNKLLKEFNKVFENIDYSVILNDPLVQKIMTIVFSENPEIELEKFLKDDLKVEQYISYKEGKSIDDLTAALMNVSLEEVITYLTSSESITSTDLLVVLGIDDIVNVNVEGLLLAVVKMANVETLNLLNDILKINSVESVELILAKYFKVEVKFSELLTNTFNSILAEYNLDLEYKTLFKNAIKNLGLDKLYAEFENIYKVFENNINEFNTNYVPLVPTKEPVSQEVLLDYIYKNALYNVFGNDAENAVSDLKSIYESILALKEHDEIVSVFNNFIGLFVNFDYSFNFDAYINDDEYLEAFNKKLTDLLNNLLNETDNAYNWVLDFEEDLENIAKALDSFTTKYFGGSFELYESVNYLFEMLDMYKMTDDMKVIYQNTIKDLVENVLRNVLVDVYEFGGKAEGLFNDLYAALEGNVLNIINTVTEFDKVIDFEAYLNNEEYRSEFNQKLVSLCNDLIDEYVLLHKEALTTEELLDEFAEYLNQLFDKYFGENKESAFIVNIDFTMLVVELFDELEYYQLTDEEIAAAKSYVEGFVNEYLTVIILDIYDISDELTTLFNELFSDISLNSESILDIVVSLTLSYYECYNYYFNMGMWDSECVVLALQNLYKNHMDQINELCELLTEVIKPSDKNLIKVVDEKLVKICDLVGLNLEYTLEDIYSDLLVLIDLLKSYEDLVGGLINPDIVEPDVNLEDIIIPN